MPVFGDPDIGDDEVAWLRARSVPPPPPPPFDEPPERPLFAPEPAAGGPARRPRTDVAQPASTGETSFAAAGFWPWDGTGPHGAIEQTSEHDAVPGRNWLRLAMVVAACLALLVAVAVAFNLGRGRTPLGAEREDPTRSPTLATPPEPTASPLPDVVAGAFDPLSDDGAENDEAVPLAVDGDPATSWTTSTYRDQLGPVLPALKSGVGLYFDLGVVREVSEVDLDLVGSPTGVELYVTDDLPEGVPTGAPVASDTATGAALTLEPVYRRAPGRRSPVATSSCGSLRSRWSRVASGRGLRRWSCVDDEVRSDVDLLAAHVAGDAEAFGQLFARHRDRLWAVGSAPPEIRKPPPTASRTASSPRSGGRAAFAAKRR